jgi:hypothetical protein
VLQVRKSPGRLGEVEESREGVFGDFVCIVMEGEMVYGGNETRRFRSLGVVE